VVTAGRRLTDKTTGFITWKAGLEDSMNIGFASAVVPRHTLNMSLLVRVFAQLWGSFFFFWSCSCGPFLLQSTHLTEVAGHFLRFFFFPTIEQLSPRGQVVETRHVYEVNTDIKLRTSANVDSGLNLSVSVGLDYRMSSILKFGTVWDWSPNGLLLRFK
jgi:hypothetical protein